ncbi:hypothetical protein BJ742DRAFT_781018 [Cladochytrium replicatum]|nr:hypothetical protein BJ742DRAFT_781018 [Cladochytrium replicatum]
MNFAGMLFNPMQSGSAQRREARLEEAKRETERSLRGLRRDRGQLEQKEKMLMAQIRDYAQRGEDSKARVVAKQLASYRSAWNRNLEAEVKLATKDQMMRADHRINRAEMEGIKRIRYANGENSLKTTKERTQRYITSMNEYELMEEMVNDAMNDIYSDDPADTTPVDIDDIVHEVTTKAQRAKEARKSAKERMPHFPSVNGLGEGVGYFINIQRYDDSAVGASIEVSTLEISVDMLKRQISEDAYAVAQLGLVGQGEDVVGRGIVKMFVVGYEDEEGAFRPFEFTESLKALGIRSGQTLLVKALNHPSYQCVKYFRPFSMRLFKIFLPFSVFNLARNPYRRFRRRFEGWYSLPKVTDRESSSDDGVCNAPNMVVGDRKLFAERIEGDRVVRECDARVASERWAGLENAAMAFAQQRETNESIDRVAGRSTATAAATLHSPATEERRSDIAHGTQVGRAESLKLSMGNRDGY